MAGARGRKPFEFPTSLFPMLGLAEVGPACVDYRAGTYCSRHAQGYQGFVVEDIYRARAYRGNQDLSFPSRGCSVVVLGHGLLDCVLG